MKLEKLDFSVAILAALSCLLMVADIPVWAVFIGWAWYFALGAQPSLIGKGIPPLIAGSVLAFVAFFLINVFTAAGLPWLFPTILAVLITVFLLMLTLKVPFLNLSLISFNAYSCVFVGFSAGTFYPIAGMPAELNAFVWITGANFLGLLFGWLSITLSALGKKN